MWATIFGLLFAATVLAFFFTHRRQRRRLEALQRSRDKIEGEETRVFDFLHGLGTALTPSSAPGDPNVLIVEGALRVLEAHGGGLYRADKFGARLVPQFVSRRCPAFFEVSDAERTQPGFEWSSHLRRRSVPIGESALGEAWRTQEPLLLHADDPRLAVTRGSPHPPCSVMISPLIHGDMKLGVLLVARDEAAEPFLTSDLRVFRAVAEQSAFALHTAHVISEAAEKKRFERELQDAQEIQRILLPANEPDITGYQISGINLPAQHVSGDYYDYIHVDDSHVGVVIADVSGKGIAASLVMATCRSVLQSAAAGQSSPAATLRTVNARLFPDIKEDMFISMAYAIIDRHSPVITLCRAGHDAPLLYSASARTVSKINPPGMVVGIDSGGAFNRVTADFSLTLERDDCLILYTDGVTEALDSQGEEFGIANVIKSILAGAPESASQMIARLTDDLRAFVGSHPQHDDITLIVIRKT